MPPSNFRSHSSGTPRVELPSVTDNRLRVRGQRPRYKGNDRCGDRSLRFGGYRPPPVSTLNTEGRRPVVSQVRPTYVLLDKNPTSANQYPSLPRIGIRFDYTVVSSSTSTPFAGFAGAFALPVSPA